MRPLNILLVEDDAMIGALLAEMLASLGHEIGKIQATEEGAVAAAARHKPDLIIADIQLAGGPGVPAGGLPTTAPYGRPARVRMPAAGGSAAPPPPPPAGYDPTQINPTALPPDAPGGPPYAGGPPPPGGGSPFGNTPLPWIVGVGAAGKGRTVHPFACRDSVLPPTEVTCSVRGEGAAAGIAAGFGFEAGFAAAWANAKPGITVRQARSRIEARARRKLVKVSSQRSAGRGCRAGQKRNGYYRQGIPAVSHRNRAASRTDAGLVSSARAR